MVTTMRAALAVVLLAGFVVFGGAVIVGLVVAGVLVYHYSNRLGAKLIFVAPAVAVAGGRPQDSPADGRTAAPV